MAVLVRFTPLRVLAHHFARPKLLPIPDRGDWRSTVARVLIAASAFFLGCWLVVLLALGYGVVKAVL